MNNLKNYSGVDPNGATKSGGKGVPGCAPMRNYTGVDPKRASGTSKSAPSMKSGGRKKRSKGGY